MMTTTTYQLRDYQTDLIERIFTHWHQGRRRVMAQLPTGGGKTICFSHLVQLFVAAGLTVLVVAHREELIKQAADKITAMTGIEPGIIKAGYKADYSRPIQVASVQSLIRRLSRCPHFDLVVVDEAHHATANSYRSILTNFLNSYILGVTATPIRLDGSGFRGLFDELVCGVTVKQLIEMGSLSPYKYYAPEQSMSLVGVKKRSGDYSAESIENANPSESVAADCLKAYRDYLQDKTVVVFAVSVQHSKAIATSFSAYGIPAAHLDGSSDSDTRSLTMAAFREGKIRVLTNCALFDEGLDIPGLDGVILARPTASLGRFLQMVGRALRPSPGKPHASIIDLAGNWTRHGLPDDDDRVWSLNGVETVKRVAQSKKLQRSSDGEIEEITIDLTPSNIKLEEIDRTRHRIESVWRRMVKILLPSTRSLIEGYGQPHSFGSGLFVISMKSPTMRQIALGKIPEISKALSQILGGQIAVKLIVRGVEVA
jgi:superfamily II DNA or RNA helicase